MIFFIFDDVYEILDYDRLLRTTILFDPVAGSWLSIEISSVPDNNVVDTYEDTGTYSLLQQLYEKYVGYFTHDAGVAFNEMYQTIKNFHDSLS